MNGLPLIWNCRTPFGAMLEAPTRDVVIVRMPKVSLNVSGESEPCVSDALSVYSGCAPIWYGHQTCGLLIVSEAFELGVKVTVCVLLAGTVTDWDTVASGEVPLGAVIVAP